MNDCEAGFHDWQQDPERRGEGLICAVCLISEAELEAGEQP